MLSSVLSIVKKHAIITGHEMDLYRELSQAIAVAMKAGLDHVARKGTQILAEERENMLRPSQQ